MTFTNCIAGQTIEDFFKRAFTGKDPADYLIRVNGNVQPSASYKMQATDVIDIIPKAILDKTITCSELRKILHKTFKEIQDNKDLFTYKVDSWAGHAEGVSLVYYDLMKTFTNEDLY